VRVVSLTNIKAPALRRERRISEIYAGAWLVSIFYTILFLLSIQPENVKPRLPRITELGTGVKCLKAPTLKKSGGWGQRENTFTLIELLY